MIQYSVERGGGIFKPIFWSKEVNEREGHFLATAVAAGIIREKIFLLHMI